MAIRKFSGRHSARARKAVIKVIRNAGGKPAKKQWVICVQTTAIKIPFWALARREERLSVSEHHVWFRGRSNGRAKILERQDREAGGNPELTVVEWRTCPVCYRVMLGLEAEVRRKLDESCKDGRLLPCHGECKRNTGGNTDERSTTGSTPLP